MPKIGDYFGDSSFVLLLKPLLVEFRDEHFLVVWIGGSGRHWEFLNAVLPSFACLLAHVFSVTCRRVGSYIIN